MIKAVIFDMDGLLIDSQPDWYNAIEEFLDANGGLKYSPQLANQIMGSGIRESIRVFKMQLGLKGDTEKLVTEMRNYFFKYFLSKPKIMDGARKIVDDFKKEKYALAVATSTGPRNKVIEILNTLQLKDYFKEIVTGDEVAKGKPDPEIYLLAAKKLGVNPLECLVIEDAANGVLSGKAAGMEVFGVNKDLRIKKELKKAGADKVFSSLSEIKL